MEKDIISNISWYNIDKTEKVNEGATMVKPEPRTYALITGASSGIGMAIATELAKYGMNLILVARRHDRLESLKNSLEVDYPIQVIIKEYDLSQLDNCVRLHSETTELHPKIVINNAGFGQIGPFDELPLMKEKEMIDLNISSVHLLTKLYVGSMQEGVIMNVASMAGFLPTPLMATYAASKAFVVNFSRAINYELKKQKRQVSVLSLCPGPVKTEFGLVAHGRETGRGMNVDRCARIAVRGLMKRKAVIIPGMQMKLVYLLLRLLPMRWVLAMSYRLQKDK
jgi:hypothetical protein